LVSVFDKEEIDADSAVAFGLTAFARPGSLGVARDLASRGRPEFIPTS
jgi:hypothetical protein